jgi:hypothetical protein
LNKKREISCLAFFVAVRIAVGYRLGNVIAEEDRAVLNGIIYFSVRQARGTCIVALRPHTVQSVAHGAVYRMEWSGNMELAVT